MKFVHLHLHTDASILDGFVKPSEYVKAAQKWKMPALGITDHGSLNNTLKFYNACKEANIKPILGCEFYLSEFIGKKNKEGKRIDAKKNHIVLFAKNETGWKNLLRLNYLSFDEQHFYYKPTISFKDIFKHKEGLIITTACKKSLIGQLILKEKYLLTEKLIKQILHNFKDDFYIEIMLNEIPDQKKVNDKLIEFANKYGIKTIITGDVHYINKNDYKIQEILLCINNKTTISDKKRFKLSTKQVFFQHPDDFYKFNEQFGYNYDKEFIEKSLENTLDLAEKVNFQFPKEKHYPSFIVTEEIKQKHKLENDSLNSKYKLLVNLCLEGLKKKQKEQLIPLEKISVYKSRLKKELEVIKKLNYIDYFLIVWDIISYAKENKIRRGVARGSVGGSLVAFLLGITDLDPVRWNTILERFMSVDRYDPPDIDIDFDKNRRDEIFNYLIEKYKNIIHIGTTQNFGVKNILRDYARVFEFSKEKLAIVDKVCKSLKGYNILPEDLENYIKSNPEIEQNLPEIKNMLKIVHKLYGATRSLGSHASGVCVTNKPIYEIMPVNKSQNVLITGYTEGVNRELTEIGVTKIDILGLKTISIIEETLKLIEQIKGKEEKEKVDKKLSRFDEWIGDVELIRELLKDNVGIFQFDSDNLWNFTKHLKPQNYKHLIDATALFRPDVIESGQAELYIKRKNEGLKPPQEFLNNPILREITKDTEYVFVYQEQIMYLLHKYFGFTMAEANLARKYISKKKKSELIKMLNEKIGDSFEKNKFIQHKDEVKNLIEMMYRYGGYSFNYAHSIAYTLISLQCLYLKNKYRVEFYTALINQNDDEEKIYKILSSAKRFGIEVLPVNINRSNWGFLIEDENKIRAGFNIIKNFSYRAYQEIVKAKQEKGGKFETLTDFFLSDIQWNYLNKNIMESLIVLGAFDEIEPNRKKVLKIYKKFMESKKKGKNKKNGSISPQLSFNLENIEKQKIKNIFDIFSLSAKDDFSLQEKIRYEKKHLGFIFWTDLFKNHSDLIYKLKMKGILTNFDLAEEKKYILGYLRKQKTVKSKKGNILHFLTFIDTAGNKRDILCFDNVYNTAEIKADNYYLFDLNCYVDKEKNIKKYSIKSIKKV